MGPDGRAGIDAALVARLVAEQFPQWRDLPVVPVEVDGWDNRTYRLGDGLSVRLPTADGYVPGVAKEHRWLPVLAPLLPLPVPEPVGLGAPSPLFPRPWSVRRWLDGAPADGTVDLSRFALDLAGFLTTLWSVDATRGPAAGEHSFFRGASLTAYDAETRDCLERLAPHRDVVPLDRAAAVWEAALRSRWEGDGVWFHGDVAVGNLLVSEGRLSAVIDFGTSGVGDPACDLVIAWTYLDGPARRLFRQAVGLDDDTWARARGWALWKALIGLRDSDDVARAPELEVVRRVVTDRG